MHVATPLYCTQISDEDLNGDAIAFGLASSPGPDWLKDAVPKVGLRLKIHNALQYFYHHCQPNKVHLLQ